MSNSELGQIKVSVVVPFWNRIDDAVEALKSVLCQTHTNLEIIFVDDGSTDDLTRLLEHCATDPRARVVRLPHQGAAVARNHGVELATGKYIAFLDSDDLFDPTKIEKQLRFMEATGSSWSHTSYRRRYIDDDRPDEIVPTGTFTGNVFPGIMTNCTIVVPTVMVKRELMLANPFPAGYIQSEDSIAWTLLAACTRLDGIDEVLSTIRTGRNTTWQNFETKIRVVTGIIHFAERHPVLSQQHVQLAQLRVEVTAYQVRSLIENLEKGDARLIGKGLQLYSMVQSVIEWEALLAGLESQRAAEPLDQSFPLRCARALLRVYRRITPPVVQDWIRPLKPILWKLRPAPLQRAE